MQEPLDTKFGWGINCYEGECLKCGTVVQIGSSKPVRKYSSVEMYDFKFQVLFSIARRRLGEECDCPEDYRIN